MEICGGGCLNHHLQYPTIQVARHETLKMAWRNQTLKSEETNTCNDPSETPHRSRLPYNPFSSCRCSLLVPLNVVKHSGAKLSEFKLFCRLRNCRGSLRRLCVRCVNFDKEVLLPNFNKTVKRQQLIMALQQLEYILHRSYIRICILVAMYLSAEWRKSRDYCVRSSSGNHRLSLPVWCLITQKMDDSPIHLRLHFLSELFTVCQQAPCNHWSVCQMNHSWVPDCWMDVSC